MILVSSLFHFVIILTYNICSTIGNYWALFSAHPLNPVPWVHELIFNYFFQKCHCNSFLSFIIFYFIFLFLRESTMELWLALSLLCSQGWHWIPNSSDPTSLALDFPSCNTLTCWVVNLAAEPSPQPYSDLFNRDLFLASTSATWFNSIWKSYSCLKWCKVKGTGWFPFHFVVGGLSILQFGENLLMRCSKVTFYGFSLTLSVFSSICWVSFETSL